MKDKIRRFFRSDTAMLIVGFVVLPILSFILISISEESPLYTSISRIAWVHGHWFKTFLWAVIVMGAITWLTYGLISASPLSDGRRNTFFRIQLVNIILVFIGCIVFPAKESPEIVRFVNYVHDYLTIAAWALYVLGLLVYSILLRKQDKFLGNLGICLMIYVIFSSIFFIFKVIDPRTYVGASAISEVYIINNITIYLMVMYIAQRYSLRLKSIEVGEDGRKLSDKDL